MVCDRCLESVKNTLKQHDLKFKHVSLGRIELKDKLSASQFELLGEALRANGFEIVAERADKIVTDIKAVVIGWVYEHNQFGNKKLSEVLSQELHYEYSHLTSIFTKAEGKSIQSFQNKIKAERIKELLEYDELNISEIADKMGFGSAAYLSTFFKKETGLNPSQFKLRHSERKSLDNI
ncbi:AraC family transcriptional regulator [Salegentibacter sp. 24]|jgi:AraC-like DNA-binding protein|nr:AraC family transcriptional regulator [Salegentibacter sp. 24]